MPQIDLEPHQYDRQDPKTGRMVRDYSPTFSRNMMLVALALLAVLFFYRDVGSSASTFGCTALFAFIAGGFFANWLKDRY